MGHRTHINKLREILLYKNGLGMGEWEQTLWSFYEKLLLGSVSSSAPNVKMLIKKRGWSNSRQNRKPHNRDNKGQWDRDGKRRHITFQETSAAMR